MKRTVLLVTLFAILGTSSPAASQRRPYEEDRRQGAGLGAITGGIVFALAQPGLERGLGVDGPASIAIAGVTGLGVFGLGIMGGYVWGAAMAEPPRLSLAPMITDGGSGVVAFGRF